MFQFNINITVSLGRTSIVSSDRTMIFYFNFIINMINKIQQLVEFSKSLVSLFFITSSLLKYFLKTSLEYLLSLITLRLKLQTISLPRYDVNGLHISIIFSNQNTFTIHIEILNGDFIILLRFSQLTYLTLLVILFVFLPSTLKQLLI